ncbi:hypothetical protein [Deinococcus sp. QL22]|uniref:hypothetical protein n=1 Tax=Deinococcus sp. QL22 TaxID=2939437 RepID=UPI002017B348|nr:hypothetical protein [Deinococcus sp. QL22]UQN10149.1 hypothetical protein M1R55_28600 [Deinococcus sp. QL22]
MTTDLNGYALKNVKTLDTSDGYAFTATLHKDGKKVANVENSGHGGPTMVWWSTRAHEDVFGAWVATLGSYTYPPMLGMETPLTVSLDPTDPATLKLIAAKAPWWSKVGEVWIIGKGWQAV